jgi:hypothetical protein
MLSHYNSFIGATLGSLLLSLATAGCADFEDELTTPAATQGAAGSPGLNVQALTAAATSTKYSALKHYDGSWRHNAFDIQTKAYVGYDNQGHVNYYGVGYINPVDPGPYQMIKGWADVKVKVELYRNGKLVYTPPACDSTSNANDPYPLQVNEWFQCQAPLAPVTKGARYYAVATMTGRLVDDGIQVSSSVRTDEISGL